MNTSLRVLGAGVRTPFTRSSDAAFVFHPTTVRPQMADIDRRANFSRLLSLVTMWLLVDGYCPAAHI